MIYYTPEGPMFGDLTPSVMGSKPHQGSLKPYFNGSRPYDIAYFVQIDPSYL